MQVSRAHVVDVLNRSGLPEAEKQRFLVLEYPADFETVCAMFERVGIDRDVLMDRMGGSP